MNFIDIGITGEDNGDTEADTAEAPTEGVNMAEVMVDNTGDNMEAIAEVIAHAEVTNLMTGPHGTNEAKHITIEEVLQADTVSKTLVIFVQMKN